MQMEIGGHGQHGGGQFSAPIPPGCRFFTGGAPACARASRPSSVGGLRGGRANVAVPPPVFYADLPTPGRVSASPCAGLPPPPFPLPPGLPVSPASPTRSRAQTEDHTPKPPSHP